MSAILIDDTSVNVPHDKIRGLLVNDISDDLPVFSVYARDYIYIYI